MQERCLGKGESTFLKILKKIVQGCIIFLLAPLLWVEIFLLNSSLVLSILVFFLLFVLSFLFLTWIHEICHKYVASYYHHKVKVILWGEEWKEKCKKMDMEMWVYCKFEVGDKFKKEEFIMIALAPLFIFSIALILSILLTNGLILIACLFILLIKINGCFHDVEMVVDACKICKNGEMIIYCEDNYFRIVEN